MISWTALNNNSSLNVHEGGCLGAVRRLDHCHQNVQKHIWSSRRQKVPRLCKLHANINVSKTSISDNYSQGVFREKDDKIPFWRKEFPTSRATSNVRVNARQDSDIMHIVHVTAELAPIAKVGGLGDVVTGLARACLNRGHRVEIMLLFYECIQKNQINDLTLSDTYSSYYNGDWVSTRAYRGHVTGIPVILIEPDNHFFKGHCVYGGSYNELEAYLFFSRACLELMQVTATQPDIIHVQVLCTVTQSLQFHQHMFRKHFARVGCPIHYCNIVKNMLAF